MPSVDKVWIKRTLWQNITTAIVVVNNDDGIDFFLNIVAFSSGDDLADVDQSDNGACCLRVVIEVQLKIAFLEFAVAFLICIIGSEWNSGRLELNSFRYCLAITTR